MRSATTWSLSPGRSWRASLRRGMSDVRQKSVSKDEVVLAVIGSLTGETTNEFQQQVEELVRGELEHDYARSHQDTEHQLISTWQNTAVSKAARGKRTDTADPRMQRCAFQDLSDDQIRHAHLCSKIVERFSAQRFAAKKRTTSPNPHFFASQSIGFLTIPGAVPAARPPQVTVCRISKPDSTIIFPSVAWKTGSGGRQLQTSTLCRKAAPEIRQRLEW